MKNLLSKAWQTLLTRGIFALLFGILAFAWPGITLISLIYLFAFYAIADGIASISGAWQYRKAEKSWGLLFFIGIMSLLAGIITLFYPGLTAIYLIIFIGIRAILDGLLTIFAAIRLRKEMANEGLMILGGIISVIFGIWVIARPGSGALAFVWLIALFAVVFGIILIMLAFKARSWQKVLTH